jgi:hypothetical protein
MLVTTLVNIEYFAVVKSSSFSPYINYSFFYSALTFCNTIRFFFEYPVS